MMRPNREAIDTFMSIAGVTEAVASQKLEEYGGDLNAAVNAHFSERDRRVVHETSVAAQDDFMDVDDPIDIVPRRNPPSVLSGVVLQPRELREMPVEVKDGSETSNRTGHAPVIEDLTGTEHVHGPNIHGTVIVDDDISAELIQSAQRNEQRDVSGDSSHEGHTRSSALEFDRLPDYSNDIEEEMVQAAIKASKREAQEISDTRPHHMQSDFEDAELAHAVSLSLKTAELEQALCEQRGKVGASEAGASNLEQVELGKIVAVNGRLETGSSSVLDEAEEEEGPLVRHRSRRNSTGSMESSDGVGVIDSPPSSPELNNVDSHPQHNGNAFHSVEWGGISSEEHDEAVMLEAAMFGGITEGTGYHCAYAAPQFMHTDGPHPQWTSCPPSPSLEAQRLIREQQDDEYRASLAFDREKEMKAMEKAEACRVQEVARKAALEEERLKEEESRKKLEQEQEVERQLALKEASLRREPSSDDENAVTLLVRMPDGSRCRRRFIKSDNLQSLFDFIDIGRLVKPGTYRLVRPYPRRAFGNGESALTLNDLGLTGKQEALFLEFI